MEIALASLRIMLGLSISRWSAFLGRILDLWFAQGSRTCVDGLRIGGVADQLSCDRIALCDMVSIRRFVAILYDVVVALRGWSL
jgi:hypothetical protein